MQAEVSLNLLEREIQRKVVEAALMYESKLREIAKWRPDSVEHFRDAAELADRHYGLGAVPPLRQLLLWAGNGIGADRKPDTHRRDLGTSSLLRILDDARLARRTSALASTSPSARSQSPPDAKLYGRNEHGSRRPAPVQIAADVNRAKDRAWAKTPRHDQIESPARAPSKLW
jgi:hypothetical protein